MGYFITFEGVEGSGKTTQIRMLAERLLAHGYKVTQTREPGGCDISDKIREILLDAQHRHMSSLTELLLYAAARAQHVNDVISPALERGEIVLCDRYCDATVAYQHCGRGINRDTIDTLNNLACQGVTPDLTILIDCDPAIGLDRARKRIEACHGPREERFELEALEFHRRVRAGYLELSEIGAHRYIVIDGIESVDDVASMIAVQALARVPEDLCAAR